MGDEHFEARRQIVERDVFEMAHDRAVLRL
jgi:hypothetical protein